LTLYHSLLRPLLFRLPPETAHEIALHSLSLAPQSITERLARRFDYRWPEELKRFNLTFKNPVGLAAGFDKNGIALNSLAALGFGFIEAGTVTFHPQPGNEKPRLFRLPEDKALINRAGFNNEGAAAFVTRLCENHPPCVLGVSIGKSKIAPLEEAVADYLNSFELVYPVADYIAVNVSSPNTPGLRDLQQSDHLRELLSVLQQKNRELSANAQPKPLLVKLSPDLHDDDLEPIVDVIRDTNAAGIIATNTTVTRTNLRTSGESVAACGAGGLSGAPLKQQSNRLIAKLFQLTGGRVPLVGVGGIFDAQDAWDKICAGASLLQLYTGFIYKGPGIAMSINQGLHELITKHGFKSLDEAVGSRASEFSTP
jgi:dihydroorotate dehydrogenase